MWLNSKCNTKFNESRVSRKRVYIVDKYDFFVRSLTLISEKGYVGCLVLRCWGATKNEWISKSAGGLKTLSLQWTAEPLLCFKRDRIAYWPSFLQASKQYCCIAHMYYSYIGIYMLGLSAVHTVLGLGWAQPAAADVCVAAAAAGKWQPRQKR